MFKKKNVLGNFEKVLKKAVKKSFAELFREHNENYYYCSLIMDEGCCPYISAWSQEALEKYLQENEIVSEEDVTAYKWSYADSPYCAYGWQYFEKVEELFMENQPEDESEYEMWTEEILRVMEKVMHDLDREGLFGKHEERKNMLINAEIMPPDYGNTIRALRLNREENIGEWLKEAAEEE